MQEGEAQHLKAMLTPIQLVRGAIAVMERVPDAAFGLSDLVANLCQRDDGKLRNQILEQILINLRGDQSIEVRTPAVDGMIICFLVFPRTNFCLVVTITCSCSAICQMAGDVA